MKLPIYIGNTNKLHLAIWNCGYQPSSRIQTLKDIRITIRYRAFPIFVIKKGDIEKTRTYSIKECKQIISKTSNK